MPIVDSLRSKYLLAICGSCLSVSVSAPLGWPCVLVSIPSPPVGAPSRLVPVPPGCGAASRLVPVPPGFGPASPCPPGWRPCVSVSACSWVGGRAPRLRCRRSWNIGVEHRPPGPRPVPPRLASVCLGFGRAGFGPCPLVWPPGPRPAFVRVVSGWHVSCRERPGPVFHGVFHGVLGLPTNGIPGPTNGSCTRNGGVV